MGGRHTGFLRSGEIIIPADTAFNKGAHLSCDDIAVDSRHSPKVLRVKIKASKTDPFRIGVNIFVGKTGNALNPVTAVLAYMVIRGPGEGPFFRFGNGKPLTRARLVAELKQALTASGIDSTLYLGHSFRIGAATTEAKQDVSNATIKTLGRWKSSAYQLYIKTGSLYISHWLLGLSLDVQHQNIYRLHTK